MNERSLTLLILFQCVLLAGALLGQQEKKRPAPGTLEKDHLTEIENLDPNRERLVNTVLAAIQEFNFNRYLYGSADPAKGGFDCSGSVYYLLRQMKIQPPRSSAAQYNWIKNSGNFTHVPATTKSIDDPIFDSLRPGDLIFWSGTYKPSDGRTNKITHVQMYLGREKKDGLRVMVGSSDGRSYRGTSRCGFGVFDLKLPRPGSKARLVGFGTPPGLASAPANP